MAEALQDIHGDLQNPTPSPETPQTPVADGRARARARGSDSRFYGNMENSNRIGGGFLYARQHSRSSA